MDQKRPRAGLFCIVSLFTISVGMLHGRKRMPSSPRAKQAQLGVQDTIDLITPLLISKSFDAIAQALSQFDQEATKAVLERIVSDDKPNLDQRDQSLLFLNIVAYSER